jgi:hypothetical protein
MCYLLSYADSLHISLAANQKRPKSLTRGRENFAREAKISLEERSIVGRPKLARALEHLATGDVLPLSADALVAETPFSGIRFETHF